MISHKTIFFSLFLVFLVACTQPTPLKPKTGNEWFDNPSFCNVDADCACGGIDTQTNDCFIGNVLYSSKYVDTSQPCPDFCSGIDGSLRTACVDHVCQSVRGVEIACSEEAKICPDGSAVGRVLPDCQFALCPGAECQFDTDCVKDSCCHSTDCVPESKEPICFDTACTEECRPGSLDCGGSCGCVEGKCIGQNYWSP